jgi:beta-xylosidase
LESTGISFTPQSVDPHGGDQGDGTYRNFILFSDYADPDAIRVGDDYYLVSSTFHFDPGLTILHSKDLVNWRIIGHAVKDLSKLHPDFSFNAMRGYSHGIWAPSLRYHDGTFYIHVGGPKIGIIVCKAKCITGPWTVTRMKFRVPWKSTKLIDCCPFWDDDGQAYLAASEPRWLETPTGKVGAYKMHLFRMDPNGEELLCGGVVIHGGQATEAVKINKINGYYYFLYCENPLDEHTTRTQFAARSKNILGPYERRKLIHSHGADTDMLPSQGGLVDTPDGKWWFLCHGMHAASPYYPVGRPIALLPVEWVDGWPIIGVDADGDGIGEMIWRHKKPFDGIMVPEKKADGFGDCETGEIGHEWQWNHQPRNDCWSLSGGHLRLKAAKPVYPGGFYGACNTLTQRIVGFDGQATVKLSTSGMADGQFAGICLLTGVSQLLGVYMEGGKKFIRYQYTKHHRVEANDGGSFCDDFFCVDAAPFEGDAIYLRIIHRHPTAELLYGTDSEVFAPAFEPKEYTFHAWRGARLGIFTWNEFKDEGCADFEFFKY